MKDTEEQVLKLRADLQAKSLELENKTKQANEKLSQMVIDQREAEHKRDDSLRIAEVFYFVFRFLFGFVCFSPSM